MFCRKCGSEIVEDSVYCSYCGVKIEEEPSGDEPRESAPSAAPAEQPDDGCIRPGMPKKRCSECGKELPGSSTSDTCAICTVRIRNRERAEQEKRDEQANANRDRYDISDEFDQSVFEKERGNYYRDPAGYSDPRRKHGYDYYNPHKTRGDGSRKGCLIALVIAGVVLIPFILTAVIGLFSFASATPEREPDLTVEPEFSISEPAEPLPDDWNLPGQAGDNAYSYTVDEVYDYFLVPAAEETLSSMLWPDDEFAVTVHRDSLVSDGAYIYVSGLFSRTHEGVYEEDPFVFGVMISELSYFPLSLFLSGEELFDYRYEIDNQGYLTPEGAEVFGMEPGDQLFDDPLFFLDELQEGGDYDMYPFDTGDSGSSDFSGFGDFDGFDSSFGAV